MIYWKAHLSKKVKESLSFATKPGRYILFGILNEVAMAQKFISLGYFPTVFGLIGFVQ